MLDALNLLFLLPFFFSTAFASQEARDGAAHRHVENIIRQYQMPKPDIKSFLNSVTEYSKIYAFTPVHGIARVFLKMDPFLFEKQYGGFDLDPFSTLNKRQERTIWFINRVRDEALVCQDNLHALDYYYLARTYERAYSTIVLEGVKVDAGFEALIENYTQNVYRYHKKAVNAQDLPYECLLSSYATLANQAFERKKYQKHIFLSEKFKAMEENLSKSQKGAEILSNNAKELEVRYGRTYWISTVAKPELDLATSYYYCGHIQESIALFERILKDEQNIKRHFDIKKGCVQLDHLTCLQSLFEDASPNDPNKLKVFSLLSQASQLVSTDLRRELKKYFMARSNLIKPQIPQVTTKKKKRKGKRSADQISKYVQASYVRELENRITQLHKSIIEAHKLEEYRLKQKELNLNSEYLSEITRILQQITQLSSQDQSSDLKKKPLETQISTLKKIYGELDALQQQLKKATSVFKESVRLKLKERLTKHKEPIYTPPNPQKNLKRETVEQHEHHKEKTKTKGSADPSYQKPDTDIGRDEAETKPINSILSWRGRNSIAKNIFDTQTPQAHPENTVELLNILNRSQNINELSDNLWAWDANLKKVHGQKGVWAFRINQQYRIRFKLTGAGFEDVRIGDFH